MKLISHRGNLNGKNPDKENSINYIYNALNQGFDSEIDIWYDNGFWLGHDEPKYKIEKKFLENNKLWCHAKNLSAISELSKINTRYFWHENDKYALTSDNLIWTYPCFELNDKSICVLPELCNINYKSLNLCYGICSDFIINYDI